MSKQFLMYGLVLVVLGGVFYITKPQVREINETPYQNFDNQVTQDDEPKIADSITSFEECVAAGNPVMESYPRQCRTNQGTLFVEKIGNELDLRDLILVDAPRPNMVITSPLEISGQARGYWFFEGSFGVTLEDGNGQKIAEHYATAADDWMVEEFVAYTSVLEFTAPVTANGVLKLHKANASGLPEHDATLEIPVLFE